jgi:transposase
VFVYARCGTWVTKHGAYLDVAVLVHIWQRWQFHEFFQDDHWVTGMVINRCIDPVAKCNVQEWMTKTVLPAYLDTDPLSMNAFDIFRELDRLCQRETELQSFMFRKIQEKRPNSLDVFFYDITSTYVTGSRCVLTKFGYSRDHRPDCEQIVIALMITPDGYPFYWQVLEGNTQDVSTICELILNVKACFPIQHCTMVFDRGMVSADNLKALEKTKWDYVSAMDRDEINVLTFFETALPMPPMPEDWEQILPMQEFQPIEDDILYYREFEDDNRRYIITFDIARFLDEHQIQRNKVEQIKRWLIKKNEDLEKAKKSRNRDTLEREISKTLKRFHVHKYLSVQITPCSHTVTTKTGKSRIVESFQLSDIIDNTALQKEQRLYGITCFISNIPQERISAQEIVHWYRRKNKIEEAFREIKSHLELRPIYLTREKRVRAHVAVCMLAYFLRNDIEFQLKEHGISSSTETALDLLAECKANRWVFDKSEAKTHLNITSVSDQQEQILKALGCESIVAVKHVKNILQKAENWL